MTTFSIGITFLAIVCGVFSANVEDQLPKVDIDVCFQKLSPAGNTFRYEIETPVGQFSGTTYLINEADPKTQRFYIQHKLVPEIRFELEVKFTEEELQAKNKFCTKAEVVIKNNGRFFWLAIPYALPFIIPAFFI